MAIAQPSNEGGPGACYTAKKVLDFNSLPLTWALAFFVQDISQISRLRFGKFTAIFKELSIFQKYDRFT